MRYRVNDIISIWVDDFLDENHGHWLGVVVRCDQEYYRIRWLVVSRPYKDTDTYRADACDSYDDMRLYYRGNS